MTRSDDNRPQPKFTIEELRQQADNLVANRMRNAPGLENIELNRTLPLYLLDPDGRQSRQELPHAIQQWLEARKGSIAQLSAPLGQGKTITTCTLQRQLQRIYPEKVCVWIPMRNIQSIDVSHPERLILKLLGLDGSLSLNRDCHNRSEIFSCVILDGVDEFLTTESGTYAQVTLINILQGLCEAGVPTLLSGRDIALENSYLHHHLHETLDALQRQHSLGHPILKLQLQTWKDTPELRQVLRERVSDAYVDREDNNLTRTNHQKLISRQLDRIKIGVLQSPLLFGLAHQILVQQISCADSEISLDALDRDITSEWDLIESWILSCLARDTLTRNIGQSSSTQRRSVAKRIALYLACCGSGISGVSIYKLDCNSKQWIWGILKACSLEDQSKVEGIKTLLLRERFDEMLNCCLLKTSNSGQHIAPFHQQILVHLAAEAIEASIQGQENFDISSYRSLEFQNISWTEIGRELQIDGLEGLGKVLDRYIDGRALNHNSEFNQAISYWVKHRYHPKIKSKIDLQNLFDIGEIETSDKTAEYFKRLRIIVEVHRANGEGKVELHQNEWPR
jgi:hypothetical protein